MAKRPVEGVETNYKGKVQFKNSAPAEKFFSALMVEQAWAEAFKGYKEGTRVQLFYETEAGTGKWQLVGEKSVPPKPKPAKAPGGKSKG